MNERLASVTKTLSEREKVSAIVWLVIGVLQCLTLACIIAGAWNIYASIRRLKHSQAVLRPWRGIVRSYDNWLPGIIKGFVINLLLGGGFGILGCLYDLFLVRGYVLSNKDVFAEAGL